MNHDEALENTNTKTANMFNCNDDEHRMLRGAQKNKRKFLNLAPSFESTKKSCN